VGAVAGAQLIGVLAEGDVTDVVQAVLDRPVATDKVGQSGGVGLGVGQAGDGVDDDGAPSAGVQSRTLRMSWMTWAACGKGEPVHGDDFEGTQLHAAVAAVAGAVQDGYVVPGQPLAAVEQGGLVGLDGEQVVRPLVLMRNSAASAWVWMGVQRVSGHHDPGQDPGRPGAGRRRGLHRVRR
jgi:hypothetical protein